MKIVVIGGTGLIGSKTVAILRQGGHEVIAASPNSGVNTITGEGIKEAVTGAQVVIDLANSPSFEEKAVLEFFETSGRNLLPAEIAASGTNLTFETGSTPRFSSSRRRPGPMSAIGTGLRRCDGSGYHLSELLH
jgi:uncharacterized protein YbjT (DUF2867 family)